MSSTELLEGLNDSQVAAVNTRERPADGLGRAR